MTIYHFEVFTMSEYTLGDPFLNPALRFREVLGGVIIHFYGYRSGSILGGVVTLAEGRYPVEVLRAIADKAEELQNEK
jgi:hypothetical protein